MESTINERIGQLVKALHQSNNAFAKSIGKSSSTINYIVEGKTKPGFELLESIMLTYPNVRPDWLMLGEGEMFRPQTTSNKQPSPPVEPADGYLQLHMKQLEDSFSRLSQQLEKKDEQLERKDEQLGKKDQQLEKKDELIAGLQRMLEVALGKFERGPFSRIWRNESEDEKAVA